MPVGRFNRKFCTIFEYFARCYIFNIQICVSGGKDTDDDEMGLVGAEADDAEAEFIRKVCEKVGLIILSKSTGPSSWNYHTLDTGMHCFRQRCEAGANHFGWSRGRNSF